MEAAISHSIAEKKNFDCNLLFLFLFEFQLLRRKFPHPKKGRQSGKTGEEEGGTEYAVC
jgi:hypothetical protein